MRSTWFVPPKSTSPEEAILHRASHPAGTRLRMADKSESPSALDRMSAAGCVGLATTGLVRLDDPEPGGVHER